MDVEVDPFKLIGIDPKSKKYSEVTALCEFKTATKGLPEKRKTMMSIFSFDSQGRGSTQTVDKVTHTLYEGAAVTLVGSLTYNKNSQGFEMKGLYAIVAGGLNEVIEILEEELTIFKLLKWFCFFTSLGFFGALYLKNRLGIH